MLFSSSPCNSVASSGLAQWSNYFLSNSPNIHRFKTSYSSKRSGFGSSTKVAVVDLRRSIRHEHPQFSPSSLESH
jgi:hypothetical protein